LFTVTAPLAPTPSTSAVIRPEDHLGLVIHLASRAFRACERPPPGLDLDDLIQEGAIGLLKAAQRIDPSRGVKFSNLAGLCASQRMGMHSRGAGGCAGSG
jgi:DNA-directed RNA polymerase specialized sigma subunit